MSRQQQARAPANLDKLHQKAHNLGVTEDDWTRLVTGTQSDAKAITAALARWSEHPVSEAEAIEIECLCLMLGTDQPNPPNRGHAQLTLRSLRMKARREGLLEPSVSGDQGAPVEATREPEPEQQQQLEYDLHQLGTGKAARH